APWVNSQYALDPLKICSTVRGELAVRSNSALVSPRLHEWSAGLFWLEPSEICQVLQPRGLPHRAGQELGKSNTKAGQQSHSAKSGNEDFSIPLFVPPGTCLVSVRYLARTLE